MDRDDSLLSQPQLCRQVTHGQVDRSVQHRRDRLGVVAAIDSAGVRFELVAQPVVADPVRRLALRGIDCRAPPKVRSA
jgi:hypothetical protein